jgi:hypothetical protein
MGIAVPVTPRNCESAEERYVRAERASRGWRGGVSGWGMLVGEGRLLDLVEW